jgi:integrase
MHEREIDNGKWIIPAERYKTKRDHVVPLGPALLAVLPKRQGFIFGEKNHGWDWIKRAVDDAIAIIRERDGRAPMPRWTIHDIRRTAASLMARAGVRQETIERVLRHVIGGIAGVYNRHRYEAEKAEALQALAAIVHQIVNPGVVSLAA